MEFDFWFPGVSHPLRPADTIPDRMQKWEKRSMQKEKTHLSRVIPCLIMWFIWAERNRCRHNDGTFRSQNVVWQTQLHIWKLSEGGKVTRKQRVGVNLPWATTNHTDQRQPAQLTLPIKWHPPDRPWIKLNTAHRFSEATGHGCGGGTIRDHHDRLLLAFNSPIRAKTALEAAAKTLIIGITEARTFGRHIWAETDDPQAIHLVNANNYGPAQSRQEVARLILLKQSGTTSFHVTCRDRNKAAVCLTKQGQEFPAPCMFNEHTAPRQLKVIIRMDRQGIPSTREDMD